MVSMGLSHCLLPASQDAERGAGPLPLGALRWPLHCPAGSAAGLWLLPFIYTRVVGIVASAAVIRRVPMRLLTILRWTWFEPRCKRTISHS